MPTRAAARAKGAGRPKRKWAQPRGAPRSGPGPGGDGRGPRRLARVPRRGRGRRTRRDGWSRPCMRGAFADLTRRSRNRAAVCGAAPAPEHCRRRGASARGFRAGSTEPEARSVVGGRSARGGDAPPRAARGPFGPTASRSEDAVGAPPAHRAPRHRRAFERRRHGAPAVRPSPWTSDRGSAGNGHRAGARAPRRQVGALPLRRGGRSKPRYAPRWWVAPVRRCLGARPPLRRSVGDGFAERRREVVGGVARLDDPRRRRVGAGPYPRPCAHRPPALGTTARREGMQRATISQHPGPSFAAKSRARCRMLDGAGPRDRSGRTDVRGVFRAVPEPPRAKLRARSGSAPSPRAPARAHGDVADGRRTRSSRPGGAGCRHARTSGKAARSGPLRGRPGRRTARAAYSEASSAGFSRSTITCRPR